MAGKKLFRKRLDYISDVHYANIHTMKRDKWSYIGKQLDKVHFALSKNNIKEAKRQLVKAEKSLDMKVTETKKCFQITYGWGKESFCLDKRGNLRSRRIPQRNYEVTLRDKKKKGRFSSEYGFGTNPPMVIRATSKKDVRDQLRKQTRRDDVSIVKIERG